MAQDKYLTYRGDLKAVAAAGPAVLFVTAHAEGRPTALGRLDVEKLTLSETPLPAGAADVVTDGQTAWVAAADRWVYRGPAVTTGAGAKFVPFKAELDVAPTKLALLAGGRVAALCGSRLVVLADKDGSVAQSFDLPAAGTALAADPSGQWLVVGTAAGTVLVLDAENRPEFLLGESAKLHEGAVTTLLFEPDDLRFLSAGADGKLLSTHARGKLEPEDKGRGNNHADVVTALAWAPGDRFLSGGRDATVKSWPRVGGVKPASVKDGLAKVVAMAVCDVGGRGRLVVACEDNTLRVFLIDSAGKVGDLSARVRGAGDWAKHELSAGEVAPREAALRQLAEWDDAASVELVAQQVQSDGDHGLRLLAAQLLSASSHPRAAPLLEKPLRHADEAVRTAAFAGLRKLRGESDLHALDLALSAEKPDVGRLAVAALQALAAKDDQAHARLTAALDRNPIEVRQAALASLEAIAPADSPEASLLALGSKHADLRRLALVRLHRRGLLGEARVQTALRRAAEDADAEVRRAAFLLSLYTRDGLAAALRARDPELDRQLTELESDAADEAKAATPVAMDAAVAGEAAKSGLKGKVKSVVSAVAGAIKSKATGRAAKADADGSKGEGTSLDPSAYDPLLQATASRALDTCLRGARGLAALRDERALGLLLQLSREKEPSARAEVARSLAALADPRGAGRLRSLLFDEDVGVRDAAFTALAALAKAERGADGRGDADGLSAADAGLGAAHPDVRRRALELVVAAARRRLPQSADDAAWPMLVRALNDGVTAVRTEAFKAALNLGVGGGGANTLRFVLQSVHPDVRREVLTEVVAQVQAPPTVAAAASPPPPAGKKSAAAPASAASATSSSVGQSWAWSLLLDLFNDPDPWLRGEAFAFAQKRTKDLGPLEAALAGRHADVRRQAVEQLAKRHSAAAQALLGKAVADADPTARLAAVDALIGDDVRDALRSALASPHDDVHARAAKALARHGDPAALAPLVELAGLPEPAQQGPERLAAWMGLVDTALDGLAELGDPAGLPAVQRLLDSPHDKLRKAAGKALAWVALAEHPGALRQAMQHADPQVKYRAALGLALGGEASAAPLVFGSDGSKVLSTKDRLAAALALGPAGEDQLVGLLDSNDERTRTHATLVLMLLELKASGGAPLRCLACLASREPRVRLRAARGLDTFREPGLFLQYVTRLFTERAAGDRDGAKPWTVAPQTVEAVADLVAFGSPAARARTSRVLGKLFADEQAEWDQAWSAHAARFAGELSAIRKAARPTPAMQYTSAQLEELAFGAYVGLMRDPATAAGGKHAASVGNPADPQAVVRARQTALTWLLELAKRTPAFAGPAAAVFTQALRDPHQPVRVQAFDQLRTLAVDATQLGAEALESGHVDLGVRGLELLRDSFASSMTATAQSAQESPAALPRVKPAARGAAKAATVATAVSTTTGNSAGAAVLEQVMLARTDDLATEAAKLLIPPRGTAAVAAAALSAAHEPLRLQAVAWLEAAYADAPAAADALRSSLTSRYAKVREAAAFALATKKDPAAFDALVKLLADAAAEPRQRAVVDALVKLGDRRTPDALLDRLERDSAKTAAAGLLIGAAGNFRLPATAPRLLGLMDASAGWRPAAGNAVLTVSGHDQRIEDVNDDRPTDRQWEATQHPRHDAVLAALLDKSLALNATDRLAKLVPAARWARGKEADPVLVKLTASQNEGIRRAAVEAVGWRARKRGGPIDPLRAALTHRDPTTQFLAAEGLALAGRSDGLSVLLSSVDLLPDLPLRRRAVEAMGVLADARALDPLLKLATEDGHVLQSAAAQSLGRLGQSPAADEVFKLLERLAKVQSGLAADALRGLRWLGTPAAWRLVRERAAAGDYWDESVALELLGHDDDPATRDLLLKLVRTDDNLQAVRIAFASARRLFGEASLEPHVAWLQNPLAEGAEDGESIDRVGRDAGAARVFELLPDVKSAFRDRLAVHLFARRPLPTSEALAALAKGPGRQGRYAARVLGRAGPGAAGDPAALEVAFGGAIDRLANAWAICRDQRTDDPEVDEIALGILTGDLCAVLWAAGRLGVAQAKVAATAARPADDPRYRPVRLSAVAALSSCATCGDEAVAALEKVAVGDDPEARAAAAAALAARRPEAAAKLVEKVLPDRVTFDRLARYLRPTGGGGTGVIGGGPASAALSVPIKAAVAQVQYQSIALPLAVSAGDVEALSATAADARLPALTRLGAVEGLGRVGSEAAEAKLRAIGTDAKEDEGLRKAAWRALRRSKRQRTAVATS